MAAHINIYEITPNIYEALQACADSEFYTFALLEPKADDSRERKRDIEKETAEVNDLINLDLLRDISYKYTTQIKDCQEEHGFEMCIRDRETEDMFLPPSDPILP